MSGIKKLAGQTIWYGASSIAARFINYLLTPYLTSVLISAQYGEMSIVYAFIPFMNVLFTYGMETAFFRFTSTADKEKVYSTASISLIGSTVLLAAILFMFQHPLSILLKVPAHPEYIGLTVAIIALDALCTIPFARLRQENRPVKFATIKITGILVNIISIYFFLSVCPKFAALNPGHWMTQYFNPDWAIGYILVANIIQNVVTLLLLSKEFFGFRWKPDAALWKEMMRYTLPLIIVGFAGMINETFDRLMLGWWAPVSTVEQAKAEAGIYSACYKLAILISLGVQAFRMGAEPFFFKQSQDANAPRTYARVMKLFVITICCMFLLVVLYLDIWKHFIRNPAMWVGLKVVPVLLFANMFLGIYYNLSIWYKLGNKTKAGAYITLLGAAITLGVNWLFIPYFSYMACAWATFACYGTMMVVSYVWGQKEYRIPYATKKLVAYMVIVTLLYFIHTGAVYLYGAAWFRFGLATLLLLSFCWFISQVERKELQKLPFIGKYI